MPGSGGTRLNAIAKMSFADSYSVFKEYASTATGMSEDLLHVHVGLLIFVFFAVVLRRRMHSLWPISAVALFAILNEIVDAFGPNWNADLSALDVLNTLFWPAILFLVARRRRISPPLGRTPPQ